MADWREQEATNETIFREMNEWTEESTDANLGIDRQMDAYLCECSDRRCTDAISLTSPGVRGGAGGVRPVRDRPGPRDPEIDRVVSENVRFATVDKFYGAGMRIARASDPRR